MLRDATQVTQELPHARVVALVDGHQARENCGAAPDGRVVGGFRRTWFGLYHRHMDAPAWQIGYAGCMMNIPSVPTRPFDDQRPGTVPALAQTRGRFREPHYPRELHPVGVRLPATLARCRAGDRRRLAASTIAKPSRCCCAWRRRTAWTLRAWAATACSPRPQRPCLIPAVQAGRRFHPYGQPPQPRRTGRRLRHQVQPGESAARLPKPSRKRSMPEAVSRAATTSCRRNAAWV